MSKNLELEMELVKKGLDPVIKYLNDVDKGLLIKADQLLKDLQDKKYGSFGHVSNEISYDVINYTRNTVRETIDFVKTIETVDQIPYVLNNLDLVIKDHTDNYNTNRDRKTTVELYSLDFIEADKLMKFNQQVLTLYVNVKTFIEKVDIMDIKGKTIEKKIEEKKDKEVKK